MSSTESHDDRVVAFSRLANGLIDEVGRVLVGQEPMLSRLLIGLLTGGHVLLEGVPGLAKTLAVRCLAHAIDTGFSRIQFTPDMLPADVTGTEIFNPREGTYSIKKGPIFSNLILADEINRAPAKVHNLQLFISAGVIHFDLEHKTVQLGLGKGIGPFLFNGILRGQD